MFVSVIKGVCLAYVVYNHYMDMANGPILNRQHHYRLDILRQAVPMADMLLYIMRKWHIVCMMQYILTLWTMRIWYEAHQYIHIELYCYYSVVGVRQLIFWPAQFDNTLYLTCYFKMSDILYRQQAMQTFHKIHPQSLINIIHNIQPLIIKPISKHLILTSWVC